MQRLTRSLFCFLGGPFLQQCHGWFLLDFLFSVLTLAHAAISGMGRALKGWEPMDRFKSLLLGVVQLFLSSPVMKRHSNRRYPFADWFGLVAMSAKQVE